MDRWEMVGFHGQPDISVRADCLTTYIASCHYDELILDGTWPPWCWFVQMVNCIVRQMPMYSVRDDEPHCGVVHADQTCWSWSSVATFCWLQCGFLAKRYDHEINHSINSYALVFVIIIAFLCLRWRYRHPVVITDAVFFLLSFLLLFMPPPPWHLHSLLLSENKCKSNWNFNTTCRMILVHVWLLFC